MSQTRRLWKRLVSCAVLAGLLVTSTRATAAPLAIDAIEAIQLRYEAPRDVPDCLSEPELEMAVTERLPAGATLERNADAPVRVTIEIVRDARAGLRATIALEEQGRENDAVQDLVASAAECRTLGIAAALAASLAIERSIDRRREKLPAPPPPPRVPESRRDRRPPRPAPLVQRPPSIGIATHASGRIGYGILPAPTAGAAAGATIDLGGWRAGLEVGAFLPAEAASPHGGGANASLSFMAATPCRRLERFEACAVAAIGDFRAAGTGPLLSRSSHALYVAIGLRAGIELFRANPFSFVAHAAVVTPLVRPSLRIAEELLWKAPVVAGEAGLTWRITIL